MAGTFLCIPYINDRLPLYIRLTLAGVIYRNRINKGATVYGLAKLIGYDYNTIKAHLEKLASAGYIQFDGGKWYAQSPINNDLFHHYKWKKKTDWAKPWWENIRTIKIRHLTLPLTKRRAIVPAVVLELLTNHLNKRQTIKGLADMLGVGKSTIQRAIKFLASKNWITYEMIVDSSGRTIGYDFAANPS
jgi:DNA-binding MarR family transcriptional regulator